MARPGNLAGLRLPAVAPGVHDGLWADLPGPWRSDVLGPATVPGWAELTGPRDPGHTVSLVGIPVPLRVELAWMMRWSAGDGQRIQRGRWGNVASLLRHAAGNGLALPGSFTVLDQAAAVRLLQVAFESRNGRLPSLDSVGHWQHAFATCFQALCVRALGLGGGEWWEFDVWKPRIDPRLDALLRPVEPSRPVAVYWRNIEQGWLREAAKWQYAIRLGAGGYCWSTVVHRSARLSFLSRWLADRGIDEPGLGAGGDADALRALCRDFERWLGVPREGRDRSNSAKGRAPRSAGPKVALDTMATVRDFYDFMSSDHDGAAAALGDRRWAAVAEVHGTFWRVGQGRRRAEPALRADNYVDRAAMSRIAQHLHVLGAAADEEFEVVVDGGPTRVSGLADPQAMRALTIQMMTGRRRSEVLLMGFDPLSSIEGLGSAEDRERSGAVARLTYAQSKIEGAPDSILVDRAVCEVVREQQEWLRAAFPGVAEFPHLFVQRMSNREARKPYPSHTYSATLGRFARAVAVRDAQGRPVPMNRTHRFRHTRLTELAEMGLPVHVIQRYAGHASPKMSMHYIADRAEHQEQVFLAATKFRADGREFPVTHEVHDSLHLFDRADRFLPNGYCLLPPLQTCDKGNACLTCGEFVTDATHLAAMREQLAATTSLVERRRAQFRERQGFEMPEDNVWLRERLIEATALEHLIGKLTGCSGGGALRGGGTEARGEILVPLDTTRHRRPI